MEHVSKSLHPLRTWRSEQTPKVTLEMLAGEIGVVPSHLSQIENGIKSASLRVAGMLSGRTGLPPESFLRPDDREPA